MVHLSSLYTCIHSHTNPVFKHRCTCTYIYSCPLSPAVSKASSGAMELTPVYSVNNIGEFLSEASDTGWKIFGTCSSTLNENSASNMPVLQCSQHIMKDPTIIALGEYVCMQ